MKLIYKTGNTFKGPFYSQELGLTKVTKNKFPPNLGKCTKKGTINLLLRETELGLIFTFNVKETRLSNDSCFMVSGLLNQLGHNQNENGSISYA